MVRANLGSPSAQPPLTNARVNRLLRPLRNKCISLAAFWSHGNLRFSNASSAENSLSQASLNCRNKYSASSKRRRKLPLPSGSTDNKALFGPLSSFIDVAHSRGMLEASFANLPALYGVSLGDIYPKVVAVRDAFRNVIEAVFAEDHNQGNRIRALSEIMARTCGSEIESDIVEQADPDHPMTADEWYDQIPIHIRRWTLVVHAIDIILVRIPVFLPGLFESLLDICLELSAYNETRDILRHLLNHAFSPNSAFVTLPINLKMHDDYLFNLKHKYVVRWPEADFVQSLMESIRSCPATHLASAWHSAALDILFRDANLDSATRIALSLAKYCRRYEDHVARSTLADWIGDILRRCGNKAVDDVDEECMGDLGMALAMLQDPDVDQGSHLQAAFVSFATYLLTLPTTTHSSEIIPHLSSIIPHRTAFTPLINTLPAQSPLSIMQAYQALSDAPLQEMAACFLAYALKSWPCDNEELHRLIDMIGAAGDPRISHSGKWRRDGTSSASEQSTPQFQDLSRRSIMTTTHGKIGRKRSFTEAFCPLSVPSSPDPICLLDHAWPSPGAGADLRNRGRVLKKWTNVRQINNAHRTQIYSPILSLDPNSSSTLITSGTDCRSSSKITYFSSRPSLHDLEPDDLDLFAISLP